MGTLAINPNYQQQGSRPLPLFFGYALASGDTMIPFTCVDSSGLNYIAIADGDNDGIEQAAYISGGQLFSTNLKPSVETPAVNALLPAVDIAFHSGSWTPIGLTPSAVSVGPDQGVDSDFANIPTLTPLQSFSNICYLRVKSPGAGESSPGKLWYTPASPISFFGVLRGARCRYFDENGNVTGYGFTTNPVWHRIEMLLRYKFKRQQPQIAGLTPAELACFNWPSIVALAARNDYILPNGSPRFTGNYVFASNATLASMLETSCRCDRSYIDDQDGQIGFFAHDYKYPSFALTGAHIVPGTWKCEKKDLTNAPNVFIPTFRDLNIQALLPVNSLNVSNAGGESDGVLGTSAGVWGAWFDVGGKNPFPGSAIFWYGDGSNPSLNHDYVSVVSPPATDINPQLLGWVPSDISALGIQTSEGGYIGTQSSRFAPRAPNTVQHSRHQVATASIAPGVAPLANVKSVKYDLGNMTYDQANRLMQYEMNRTLGLNVPGWVAPQTGSLTIIAGSVDESFNVADRLRPFEQFGIFTIDDTVSPENVAAGNTTFMVTKVTNIPPSKAQPVGAVEVEFESALPAEAYPDTSYTPDSSLLTIASAALPSLGKSLQMSNVAWTIQATPDWSGSSLTIPDLAIQVLGEAGFREYPTASWTGLPTSGPLYLWVLDPAPGVDPPTFGFTTDPTILPASTSYPVYAGGISLLWTAP